MNKETNRVEQMTKIQKEALELFTKKNIDGKKYSQVQQLFEHF